jgi:hypothetical protein
MIILDNLDLQDIEILRVLRGAPSEGLAANVIMSSGNNLVSTENVSKKLQRLLDLKLVIPLENARYRLHLDGENLFWGKGELWSKFLHVVYVVSLEMGLSLEAIQRIIGEPDWKFQSALEVLRPRGYLHRNDVKTMGGQEVHLWTLTPEGKQYVISEFSFQNRSKPEVDLREIIIKTEENLRDLVYSVLMREYGTKWETDPNLGWSNDQRKGLQKRLEDRKNEFPTKQNPNRLIDYCYILNLKLLITKPNNEKLFKSIFQEWQKHLTFFDELGKHRDPIMHGTNVLTETEKNLCIGICGEFDKVIEHWKRGFSRKIISISVDLMFDELEGSEPEKAKMNALKNGNTYLEKVKSLAIGEISTKFIDGRGDALRIKLKEGDAEITIPSITRQCYREGYAQSARIFIMVDNVNVLDKILTAGNHTYWNIEWIIPDLDVSNLSSKINELHGRKIPYQLPNEKNLRIVIDVRATSNNLVQINLTNQEGGGFDTGFTKAHKDFDPDKILAILYDSIPIPQLRKLVDDSLKKS